MGYTAELTTHNILCVHTLAAAGADDHNKLCKCVRDSRDVSGIVANTEVLLKLHGFIRGAELETRRE